MTDLVTTTGMKVARAILGRLRKALDPTHKLDEQVVTQLLDEGPRLHGILEALETRVEHIASSGCSVEEALIIVHQVVEAQRRTLDPEKRRRLRNVLVNGFAFSGWNIAMHRLMIRLTDVLEEEHIERLRLRVGRTVRVREQQLEQEAIEDAQYPNETERQKFNRRQMRPAIEEALDRELVAAGLLDEVNPGKPSGASHPPGAFPRKDLESRTQISFLGRRFLEFLSDPN